MTEPLSTQKLDQLALAARNGNAQALAQLYETLGPAVLGFLQHILQDQYSAEDILHETFLRLFEGRGNWTPDGKLESWLFTVARRLALDKIRASNRHQKMIGTPEAQDIMGQFHNPDSGLGLAFLDNLVAKTLATLPKGYATVFHLRIGQEFTYPEIAVICNEPEGTLRSRVHHTLKLLRKALTTEASKGQNNE